jgi:ATP-dependent helicase/nuclease subunit B
MRPNVISIPPTRSFIRDLETLIDTKDVLKCAALTIYLPNRRLCRHLTETLIEQGVRLLPRILPMGEEDVFDESEPLPEVIHDNERILLISRFIREWKPITIAESLHSAGELSKLLDQFTTEGLSPELLKTLDIAHDHDEYWELSRKFLEITAIAYPLILAASQKIDTAMRRNLILTHEAERLSQSNAFVIAAGSTGSIKATRQFLKAVAHMKNGLVVLPGLDNILSRDDFAAIEGDHGHPQYGLKRLIMDIGVERLDGVLYPLQPLNMPREKLISEVLRPATRTHLWAGGETDKAALAGLMLIEALDERAEALSLALFIREKLESDETIAVITPDRTLVERLKAELSRWNIIADDSGGTALSETPAAIYMRLILSLHTLSPAPFMSFLSHSLSPWHHEEEALTAIDLLCLRGLPPASFADMRARLKRDVRRPPHPESRISEDAKERARFIINEAEAILKPPFTLTLAGFATHLQTILGDISKDLYAFLEGLKGEEAQTLVIVPYEAEAIFMRFMAGATPTRPTFDKTAKVHILGLPEARGVEADHVIMAGLNETIWPIRTETDPWLSRAMGARVGLEPPERRIGLAAHDFMLGLGNKNCILSRSLKKDGNPTVASRWLQRLKAVLTPDDWGALLQKGQIYWRYATEFDRNTLYTPAKPPNPMPPLAVRPQRLSVTEIEKLIRDPYAIYAKHILKLLPLDPYEVSLGGRDRGNLIHDIIANYAKEYKKGLVDTPLETMLALGRKAFKPYMNEPMVASFWWSRFLRLAEQFVRFDAELRGALTTSHSETGGSVTFPLPTGRQFTLITRADRIDETADGLKIYDYKTGQTPSKKEVKLFLASQLPLTALIATKGGIKDIAAGQDIAAFGYIPLKESENELSFVEIADPQDLTLQAEIQLLELITKFENEATAYTSHRMPKHMSYAGDYDMLARVAEWQAGEEE